MFKMPRLTFISMCLWLVAKIIGMIGVALSYGSGHLRSLGETLLWTALGVCGVAILLAILQLMREQTVWFLENDISALRKRKQALEDEVKRLPALNFDHLAAIGVRDLKNYTPNKHDV